MLGVIRTTHGVAGERFDVFVTDHVQFGTAGIEVPPKLGHIRQTLGVIE